MIGQVFFKSPHMKPFVNFLPDDNNVFPSSFEMIENSMGSNSSAIVFPHFIDRVNLGVLSGSMTALHLCLQPSLTSAHLQAIAVACPNLIHLDLQNSGKCLNDLNGLNSIALFCSKLQCLNIDDFNATIFESVNVDRLWHVIAGMKNLTVLTVSSSSIPRGSEHGVLPTLKAIHIMCELNCHTCFIDEDF